MEEEWQVGLGEGSEAEGEAERVRSTRSTIVYVCMYVSGRGKGGR